MIYTFKAFTEEFSYYKTVSFKVKKDTRIQGNGHMAICIIFLHQ